jgi:sulfur-oxidizing protein SoxY
MSSAISPRSGRPEAGLDRRSFVTGAAAGLAIAAFPGAAAAQTGLAAAEPSPELAQLIARVTEGAVPERARITLDIPALVENGNSVDTRISVESAMTDAEHVRWIHLIAEKNPFPDMARFHLGPRAGRAEVATTLRLAQSQKITAVAALSGGGFVLADADIVVTLSACIDGG